MSEDRADRPDGAGVPATGRRPWGPLRLTRFDVSATGAAGGLGGDGAAQATSCSCLTAMS